MRIAIRQKRGARIEMVPLIDCVFLLLTFFIYAMVTMTVHRGVKVELPEAGRPRPELQEHVTVTIDKSGRVFVQSEPVDIDGLIPAVEKALGAVKEKRVAVDGDKSAELGVGVKVLERLGRIPEIRVSFSVKEEK